MSDTFDMPPLPSFINDRAVRLMKLAQVLAVVDPPTNRVPTQFTPVNVSDPLAVAYSEFIREARKRYDDELRAFIDDAKAARDGIVAWATRIATTARETALGASADGQQELDLDNPGGKS